MRLTLYTDYSLRVLIYLGLRGNELSTIQSISDAYGISRNHLMKVVQELARQGYVESVRGQGGGLRLRRPAGDIRLGEVVSAMEPDLALVECFRADNSCVITPACQLPAILNRALNAFVDELDRHTLAELLSVSTSNEISALLNIRQIDA